MLHDPTADAALRFQQTSGMVMAKGVEDCAFYRYSRLTSLNEVGGDPSVFSTTPAQFHGYAARRQHEWPDAMTALTTHDTKRSEDVRARITALAEVPELWEATLDRLLELAPVPDPGFGNLLWQAVVGVWPTEPDATLRGRLHAYAEKAMREAGDRTTWTAVDEGYEAAVHAAVDAAFEDDRVRDVLDELLARITTAGWSNALAAKLLALTMPGVPDVYQGTERMMLALVDPDNRQPVDFPDAVEGSGWSSWRPLQHSTRRGEVDRDRHRAETASRPTRAVHLVRRGPGRGLCCRPRARVRPGRRDHRGHATSARPGGEGRLGRHRASVAGG